jgi:hypothetical protein
MTTSLPPSGIESALPLTMRTGVGNAVLSRYNMRYNNMQPEEQIYLKNKSQWVMHQDMTDPVQLNPWMTYVDRRPIDSNDETALTVPKNQEFPLRPEYIGNEFQDYSKNAAIVQSFFVQDSRSDLHDAPVTEAYNQRRPM